jgi:hypothetical protein
MTVAHSTDRLRDIVGSGAASDLLGHTCATIPTSRCTDQARTSWSASGRSTLHDGR